VTSVLDEAGFREQAARYRRELHVHCYRMLASFDEAEDAVQEALLNAWRHREKFDGSGPMRAWLYRIATNVCLDMIRAAGRQVRTTEVPWLQPYPDQLLVAPEDGPETVAVTRETIELAFLVALQVLPARQRAALLLRDVLDMSAAETAELLEVSVAAANSALQRARATMAKHLPPRRSGWSADATRLSVAERELLDRFVDAHQRCDAAAALAAAATDIRITMPPNPARFDGIDDLTTLLTRAFGPDRDGDWLLVPTAANRMPAAASYLRRPGDTVFRAFKLDVIRVTEGPLIAEITTFGPSRFPAFGLPDTRSTDPT
jgi:RNA polymerase sigma-70 factor (ECF subfamily)